MKTAFFLILLCLQGCVHFQRSSAPGMDDYDVLHYDLSIALDLLHKTFTGNTTVTLEALREIDTLLLHASHETLTIDSVSCENNSVQYVHQSDTLKIRFPEHLQHTTRKSVTIFYHGISNFHGDYEGGGIYFSRTNHAATISEPSYARTWWPCKDLPSDKATASISITVPESLKAVSNGTLKSVVRRGHAAEYRWETQYPIATYLISLAVANYREYSVPYVGAQGDSMKITFFVFPEDYAKTLTDFQNAGTVLKYFSETFCEYPFINEKFGIAEVDGELTMENQTLCSIQANRITGDRRFELATVVHETAHQWWGNLITPRNWKHTWLSEGFAEYAEALYLEHRRGHALYQEYIGKMMSFASGSFAGSIVGQSDTAFWDSFAPRVYHKGALVLHMLRGMMRDSVFFSMMKQYLSDPKLRYANAVTEDFVKACEQAYGQPLDWFFDEWVYSSADSIDRPVYEYVWRSRPEKGEYIVTVDIGQPEAAKWLYRMPMSITVSHGTADTTFTVVDSLAKQSFSFNIAEAPDSVEIDKENYIFKQLIKKGLR